MVICRNAEVVQIGKPLFEATAVVSFAPSVVVTLSVGSEFPPLLKVKITKNILLISPLRRTASGTGAIINTARLCARVLLCSDKLVYK